MGMTTRETKDEKARRLAEQLRENLKRRKAQARAMKGGGDVSERQDADRD